MPRRADRRGLGLGAAGESVAVHVREDLSDGRKRYRWERDGKSGLRGLPVEDLPLFGSEKVKEWRADMPIFLTEGEKPREALTKHGFYALATVTGANGTSSLVVLSVLDGRNVILWPDNDNVGRAHMEGIANRLAGRGARLRRLDWGEEDGDDAFDFFAGGGTKEQLRELARGTPDWVPSTT